MMKCLLIIPIFCLLLTACNSGREPIKQLMQDNGSGLVQDKQVGDAKVRLTYLPLGWEKLTDQHVEEENETEMAFRVNISQNNQTGNPRTIDEKVASYGVDTLFQLILNRDTLAPVSAERIANGNLGGITYLVIFERKPLLPVQQAAFVFKDWLLTNTRLVFPLQKKNILIADSLSHRL